MMSNIFAQSISSMMMMCKMPMQMCMSRRCCTILRCACP